MREYNGFNELTKLYRDGIETSYTYRPDNLRHQKLFADGTETYHIWDGASIIAEYGANGSITDRFIRGINLISSDKQGYFVFNAHGDVVELADSSGNIRRQYDYNAFGVEVAADKNDNNLWRYCGEYYDFEADMYYLRARSYNPMNGRFFTEDTLRAQSQKLPNGQRIIDPLSLNLYTYCGNNPIRFIDPSGHKRIDTDYIYYEYKTVTYKSGGKWKAYTIKIPHYLTKAEFTNLNTTLYTENGVKFHTNPASLINGEYLWMRDPDNLMKLPDADKHGGGVTSNLNAVEKMDKELGWRIFKGFTSSTISLIGDVAGGVGSAAVKLGSKAVEKVTGVIDKAATGISVAESAGKAISGDINSLEDIGWEIVGYIPFVGTAIGYYDAIEQLNYEVKYD